MIVQSDQFLRSYVLTDSIMIELHFICHSLHGKTSSTGVN